MTPRPRRALCQCHRSLPYSSTLLFLSIILPTSSFAQITNPASSATSVLQTTLQTSATSPSPPPTASDSAASNTQSNAVVTPTVPPNDPDNVQDHVFNYYFLIIAVVAVLFCIGILYIGKRKKRKAAIQRSASQRALATDVAGFRARFGPRVARSGVASSGGRPAVDRVEGLDDRGEAPPPYVPGTKPPSIRSTDGVRAVESRASDVDVELDDMRRPTAPIHPPVYNESSEGTESEMRRPPAAAVPDGRTGPQVVRETTSSSGPLDVLRHLERQRQR